jgi:hypothetical protein
VLIIALGYAHLAVLDQRVSANDACGQRFARRDDQGLGPDASAGLRGKFGSSTWSLSFCRVCPSFFAVRPCSPVIAGYPGIDHSRSLQAAIIAVGLGFALFLLAVISVRPPRFISRIAGVLCWWC